MINLNTAAKVHADEQAKKAIVRLYSRQRARHPVPMFAVEGDLPTDGLLTYSEDPASYYFDRDAHRSFFYCSAGTETEASARVAVRLQLCAEQYSNGTAAGGVAETLVIRRLPASGNWY